MPFYNWMGVAKATLESVNRYVAEEVGAASDPLEPRCRRPDQDPCRQGDCRRPHRSGAAKMDQLNAYWDGAAPIGWDVDDPTAGRQDDRAPLLSDWLPGTTGSIVYVDGGRSTRLRSASVAIPSTHTGEYPGDPRRTARHGTMDS